MVAGVWHRWHRWHRWPGGNADGGSLPNRLIAILAVPLLAVGVATASQAASEISRARTANHLSSLVRDIAEVEGVRHGVEHEVIPSLAAAVTRDPTVDKSGADPSVAVAKGAARQLPSLQAATDRAYAKADLASSRSAATHLATARRELLLVRRDRTTVSGTYAQWLSVVNNVGAAEDSLLAQARLAGLSKRTADALADVATVTEAAQLAGRTIGELALTFPPGPADVASRVRFLTVWGSAQTASAAVLARVSSPLRRAWTAAIDGKDARAFEAGVAVLVPSQAVKSGSYLSTLFPLNVQRQTQIDGVVQTSLSRATAAVASEKSNAQRALVLILALDALLLLITITSAVMIRLWVTRSLKRLAGQAKQVSEGEMPDVVIGGPREVRTVARALAETVMTLRSVEAQAAAVADGELDSPALYSAIPGPLGHVVHTSVVRIIDAIHDQEQAQHELAHQAAHDPLTNLPNRAYAVTLINQSLHRAQRTGGMTALMFIDLDHFKAVNDTFGHAAGDRVLQEVSRRMADVMRDGDMVARLGGDEFVVLLENVAAEAAPAKLAHRLVAALAEPIIYDGRELRVGASVGVAVCRDGHVDGDRLMREADAAAYRAKSGGRGRVDVFDDDLRRQLSDHAELEAALASALANDEFIVYYQPVMDLDSETAIGLEALLRWNRPGVGLVPPLEFIPAAEASTLINDIGRYVLGEATRQLARWQASDPDAHDLTISVNISARHLRNAQIVTDVADALAASGIAADRLIIEITETTLVDDVRATAHLQALRDLGVRVVLDDFGTGFTSIGQLSRLPIDGLKIDRSFVAATDAPHEELCKLMVSAARAFGLDVVAEGVEREEQAQLLRDIHVRSCQGFLFATPQPPDALDLRALLGHAAAVSVPG